jgi:hypothetical protein
MIALIVNIYMLRGDTPSRADLERQRAHIEQLQSQIRLVRSELEQATRSRG